MPMMRQLLNVNIRLLKVFRDLDNELIGKERRRNNALADMADNIRKVGHEIQEVANNLKTATESAAALARARQDLEAARQEESNRALSQSVSNGLSNLFGGKENNKPGNNNGKPETNQAGDKKDPMQQFIENMAQQITQAVYQGMVAAMSKPYDVTFTSTDKQISHYKATPQRR